MEKNRSFMEKNRFLRKEKFSENYGCIYLFLRELWTPYREMPASPNTGGLNGLFVGGRPLQL